MHHLKTLALGLAVAVVSMAASAPQAEAGYYNQSYSSWSYHPTNNYHYCRYNYTVRSTPSYHYTVYRPAQPRYVYYYNPVKRVYWGRFDMEKDGYSLLKQEDRKENLEDIPESAFPEPGEMPQVPESEGDKEIQMIKPDASTLPKVEAASDAP